MKYKTIEYGLECNGMFLQGIEPTENYCKTGVAPTMGTRHTYNEFETVWGKEEHYFEPLTFSSNLKVLMEEFRWETKDCIDFGCLKIVIKSEEK